jgi:hypothetical protein
MRSSSPHQNASEETTMQATVIKATSHASAEKALRDIEQMVKGSKEPSATEVDIEVSSSNATATGKITVSKNESKWIVSGRVDVDVEGQTVDISSYLLSGFNLQQCILETRESVKSNDEIIKAKNTSEVVIKSASGRKLRLRNVPQERRAEAVIRLEAKAAQLESGTPSKLEESVGTATPTVSKTLSTLTQVASFIRTITDPLFDFNTLPLVDSIKFTTKPSFKNIERNEGSSTESCVLTDGRMFLKLLIVRKPNGLRVFCASNSSQAISTAIPRSLLLSI